MLQSMGSQKVRHNLETEQLTQRPWQVCISVVNGVPEVYMLGLNELGYGEKIISSSITRFSHDSD